MEHNYLFAIHFENKPKHYVLYKKVLEEWFNGNNDLVFVADTVDDALVMLSRKHPDAVKIVSYKLKTFKEWRK